MSWVKMDDQWPFHRKLDRGMDLEHLDMCVDIAMAANPKDEWAYFCGVVWRTLKRAQAAD